MLHRPSAARISFRIARHTACILVALLSVSSLHRSRAADTEARAKVAPATRGEASRLRERERQILSIVDRALDATVCVQAAGSGSGVIVSEDGLVLTAGHVVRQSGAKVWIVLRSGRRVEGEVLGADRARDAALIRIRDDGPWVAAEMGSTGDVEEGDWCVATGHPGGFDRSRSPPLRAGRLLRKGRFLISDCTVVGGDSGGPLFDLRGRVIGVHSSIGASTAENRHVPIETFRQSWDRMLRRESWGRLGGPSAPPDRSPFLGVLLDVEAAEALVESVVPESGADRAGVRPGDTIVRIAEQEVYSYDRLVEIVRELEAGSTVSMAVRRGDEVVSLDVVLGRWSDRSGLPDPPRRRRGDVARGRFGGGRSGRRRGAGPLEKDHPDALAVYEGATEAAESAARVLRGEEVLAWATIIASDGYLLTKASEVRDGEPGNDEEETAPPRAEGLSVRLASGASVPARLLAVDGEHDIALLRCEAEGLAPIAWEEGDASLRVGRILATPRPGEPRRPVPGVVSVAPRGLRDRDGTNPFLGVRLEETSEPGVRIAQVIAGTAAASAGLRRGDVLLSIDDTNVGSAAAVVRSIADRAPGATVRLRVARGGEARDLVARIGRRSLDAERAQRLERMNRMGGELSQKRLGFPHVFQHDGEVPPEGCGGPVVDLEGRAVGINIARAGRISTYAVPATVARTVAARLLTEAGVARATDIAGPRGRAGRDALEVDLLEAKAAAWDALVEMEAARDRRSDASEGSPWAEEELDAARRRLEERRRAVRRAEEALRAAGGAPAASPGR